MQKKLGWRELEPGCAITQPGNSQAYRTGDWRTAGHPVIDQEKCIHCAQCYICCPDAAIERTQSGDFEPNLFYCKGCGICAHECPVKCIEMVEDEI